MMVVRSQRLAVIGLVVALGLVVFSSDATTAAASIRSTPRTPSTPLTDFVSTALSVTPTVTLASPTVEAAGPVDESKIPASPGPHIRTKSDGQVIENVHTNHITIQHDNVHIRNFRVTLRNRDSYFAIRLVPKADGTWPTNTVIEFGEITSQDEAGNPQPSLARGVHNGRGGIVVRGVEISYMKDGLHCGGGACVFTDNYIHHLVKYQDAHNDGIQVTGGSGAVIRGNTVLLPNHQTGTVSLFPNGSPISNVLIENNYLNGGTFTVYSRTKDNGTPSDVRIIDNRLGRDYVYGPYSLDGNVVVQGNTWADTGQPADFIDLEGLSETTVHAITCLVSYGVSKGTGNITFSPEDTVPRWQMALFLTRTLTAAGETLPDGSDQGFSDIGDLSAEAQEAINQLAQLKITMGTTGAKFSPNLTVSRVQMAQFITRLHSAAGTSLPDGTDQGFTDIGNLDAEAQTAINQLVQLGDANGTSTTTFSPLANTLRWHMALFLTRALAVEDIEPSC